MKAQKSVGKNGKNLVLHGILIFIESNKKNRIKTN